MSTGSSMSQDDVERVKEMIFAAYLDMDASDLAKRMNAGMSAREAFRLSLNGIIPEVISAYRHAALSATPQRELLAEALEALDRMLRHSGVADAHAMDKFGSDHEAERRARAAADKIRASLTQEKQP